MTSRAIVVVVGSLALLACGHVAPSVDRPVSVSVPTHARRSIDARFFGFPTNATTTDPSMTQARATVYSDAFKEALVRIACTPGRTVDVDGEVKALDLRVETDGAERACPVHHEGAVQGTMRIREVAKLYRTDSHWEVVVEIDAVVGVSAAAMENLRTSVRDIAKQVRDLPKGDWTLPAQPQPQPRDTATDCVASCSRDRFARPDATCASNCWNAYTPASSSNDDHTLEIVGGIILVVGVVTAVVAPIIWVWNECANHRCNGPK